jgi:pimeloyl-ACP methyl ester carboxylesterase
VRVHALGNDRAVADAQIWSWLVEGVQGLPAATFAQDAALPADQLGDTLVGREGRRWHLRGATAGAGRPLVWLHPSPGGARALDRSLETQLGQRPLLAVDLPNHGESDAWLAEPEALLAELAALIDGLGLHDAELRGEGLGGAVAAALARHLPQAAAPPAPPAAPCDPPEPCPPRADGGHLMAAWLHAHDEAVLGSWWTRASQPRFCCADALDVSAVHAHAIEMLKEGEGAAAMRSSWLGRSGAR